MKTYDWHKEFEDWYDNYFKTDDYENYFKDAEVGNI